MQYRFPNVRRWWGHLKEVKKAVENIQKVSEVQIVINEITSTECHNTHGIEDMLSLKC